MHATFMQIFHTAQFTNFTPFKESVIDYNFIFAGKLLYCGILNYFPLIEMLNLVIHYTHRTLNVILHSAKCGVRGYPFTGGSGT